MTLKKTEITKNTEGGIKKYVNDALEIVGEASSFVGKTLASFFTFFVKPPFETNELIKQGYLLGNKSLALVGITGFIMGMVLTLQSRPVLADFGAESWLPSMVSLSFIREIGPVITALICAGRIGSSIGAEVSSMKVTEQIEAMEVSATNPFKFIVMTRVIACCIVVPILIIFADITGLIGAYVGVNFTSDMSFSLFLTKSFGAVSFLDLYPSLIKSFFFGLAIGVVGCYQGYYAGKGTESVGLAANSSVVVSSLFIFIIDLIAVQIITLLHVFGVN